MKYVIVAGTSEPQRFVLHDKTGPINGALWPVVTVSIAAHNDGVTPPVLTAAWDDPGAGVLLVSGVEALALGGYNVRFRLRDASNKFGYCPNESPPDVWDVVKVV